MNRKFQSGLKYVFSYKKYKKFYRELGLQPGGFARSLNGRIVDTSTWTIDGIKVHPIWCKCVGKEEMI